jgi:hypothetical protein
LSQEELRDACHRNRRLPQVGGEMNEGEETMNILNMRNKQEKCLLIRKGTIGG